MFCDRARSSRPDFRLTKHNARAVARLCATLEGLPLAIELCAARASEMSPSKMLARLERRLDFLSAVSPSASTYRHPTLRAALEWSYTLLWPQLQQFFARLSVFRGGFSAQAASVVTNEPHGTHFLEQLRASSLVVRDDTGAHPRFRFLETVREFAGEQLNPSEEDLPRRHAGFFRQLVADEPRPSRRPLNRRQRVLQAVGCR